MKGLLQVTIRVKWSLRHFYALTIVLFTETLVHVYEGLCALAIPLWMSLVHGSAVLTKCCRLCLKGFNIQGVWVSHGLNFMWIWPYWWRFLLKEVVVVLVGGKLS